MWGNLNLPISIHALHEESDWTGPEHRSCNRFQSTLSMRRATGRVDGGVDVLPVISIHALHEESDPCFERSVILLHISIHALHEESDSGRCSWRCRCRWISIHALHEESDHIDQSPAVAIKFQSTLSMRRATPNRTAPCRPARISIHALHEESDHYPDARIYRQVDFNPRSP